MVPDTVVVPILPLAAENKLSIPTPDAVHHLPGSTGSANAASGSSEDDSAPLPIEDIQEYVNILRDMLDLNKNLIVAANFEHHVVPPTDIKGGDPLAVNTWADRLGVAATCLTSIRT